MNCPECHAGLPSGARFCAYCGTAVRICAACTSVWRSDAMFCGSCGHRMMDAETSAVEDDPITETGIGVFADEELEDDDEPRDAIGYLYERESPTTRHHLRVGEWTVGAGNKNDIILARPAVSWNHALILVRTDRVRLQDSASTNGTYVNDLRLQRPMDVTHGDIIKFGNIEMVVWLRPQYRE